MEVLILGLFLTLFALEFITEFSLNELNLRHVRHRWRGRTIPDPFRERITPGQYDQSVRYTLAKGHFQRWALVYGSAVTLIVLFAGPLPYLERLSADLAGGLDPANYSQGILFCFLVAVILSLANLPVELYATFGLEARFGFNKTTPGLYVADKLKTLLLAVVIGVPFLFVVLWLMAAAGPWWWLWAFLFVTGFQLLMIVVYPTVIAPWFNRFEPLPEGEFRRRILTLAEEIGFRTSGIYLMDGSRRSAHSNAYFTGLGGAKRIVLFDTLVAEMNVDQGLAVLAHEMGHYKMKHIRRMLLVQTVFLFAGLYVLSLLIDYDPLFSAFGLSGPSSAGALVLFSLLSGPFTFFIGPLMNLFSRRHEYEADRFAVATLRDGKPMEEALVNLTVRNLANLTPHPWYSAYHYSHPTPVERITAIRSYL